MSCLEISTPMSVMGKKFVNRSEAVRASIRKTLDQLDEIDARQGRIDDE